MLKRPSLAILALAVMVIATACGQKNDAPAAMTGKAPASLAADSAAGFNILHKLSLMTEKDDGSLAFKEALTLGEKLAVLAEPVKKMDPYAKAEKDFLKVKRESGTEGLARADYIVTKSTLGVIVAEDSMIYSQPKNESATVDVLPNLCIIAVSNDFTSQNFVLASAVEPVKGTLRKNVYLRKESISTSAEDASSAILFFLARKSDNSKQRETLLKSAQTDYPGSVIAPMITKYLNALTLPDAGKPTETYETSMTVIEDSVNVRSIPDEDFGAVTGTLKKDATVGTLKRTVDTYTIKDDTAPWYKISAPEGWVFGKYLEEESDAEGMGDFEDTP
jgi:hypothetical protein